MLTPYVAHILFTDSVVHHLVVLGNPKQSPGATTVIATAVIEKDVPRHKGTVGKKLAQQRAKHFLVPRIIAHEGTN